MLHELPSSHNGWLYIWWFYENPSARIRKMKAVITGGVGTVAENFGRHFAYTSSFGEDFSWIDMN